MKKSFLFISCEEAKHICDKTQYGESTGWERFKLALRLSWCHITKSYSKKNSKLSKAIKDSKVKCLKNSEKNQIKAQFNKELSKHQ